MIEIYSRYFEETTEEGDFLASVESFEELDRAIKFIKETNFYIVEDGFEGKYMDHQIIIKNDQAYVEVVYG